MPTKKKISTYSFLLALAFAGTPWAYGGQQVVPEDLLVLVRNEVSGERAWDTMSKISRYHRIRGGGEGSDYNRCVDWLAAELEELGVDDVSVKEYRADGFERSFLWLSMVGWKATEAGAVAHRTLQEAVLPLLRPGRESDALFTGRRSGSRGCVRRVG